MGFGHRSSLQSSEVRFDRCLTLLRRLWDGFYRKARGGDYNSGG